ncbi:MAG: YraN family protein [Fusobacteria bacterium]|jgi:putative endonuclease|nr:YraN family protein [Fusobacteriota bacterium]
MNNVEKGKVGEEKAVELLINKGCKIVTKNYYCVYGEIDIIVEKDNWIFFVEVKYRKNKEYGYAINSISKKKQRSIYKTALHYITSKNLDCNYRFDVIAIDSDNIEWIENAFWGDEIGF